MKQFKWIFIAALALASAATAQDRLLTIDDIFSSDPKVRINFGGVPSRFQWTADGKAFVKIEDGKPTRVDAISGQSMPIFDVLGFIEAAVKAGIGARDAQKIAETGGLKFDSDDTSAVFDFGSDLYVYQLPLATVRRLTNTEGEEMEANFSPDSRWVSFVRGNDLHVVDVRNGNEKQLTRDGGEKIFNGYLDWVYEEELYGRGDKRAYWWSPDSRYIAFLRLDESPVPKFVIPNDTITNQVVENTDYPQAGDPNPLVRLGIAEVSKTPLLPNPGRIPQVGKKLPGSVLRFGDVVQFVDLSKYKPEDLLVVRVTWTPDSRAVIYQAQNREQTYLDLNAATVDGKSQTLFTETSTAWVGINDNPLFLKDGTAVWQSERDGWNHLYQYDNNGKLIKWITSGRWEVRTVYGADDGGWVYFSSTKDSHIAENVYRVRVSDGTIERLTKTDGSHAASFNSTFTHFVDTWSDVNHPPQARLYRADGTLERVLNENKVDVLSQFKLGASEFVKVKTRDGFEMEAMMILPPDFDHSKKYPVLSYTYGGPHAPSVVNRWGGSRYMWHQMMAQKGYIIWVCDNRTASGKGLESAWPVYKNFGQLELRDLEDGVNYLKSLPYVDGDRIGLWGWSYGGFMTSYALTHSKAFKIGIAGGTVSDWRLYDSIYTERYMLTPQNNMQGYERASVQRAAANLSGRLLLIHGMMDDNVHMQNTTQLAFEFQKAGKPFELMLYPTARHGLTNPAQIKHWYSMMTGFVERNL
jgi:dipeptidyl-peptidase 4